MALKTISENPTITDEIVFDINTPGPDGCFSANPYKVDRCVIYFLERSYIYGNEREFDEVTIDPTKDAAAQVAEALVCTTPTSDNISKAKQLRDVANASATSQAVYFNNALVVKVFGTDSFPAWLSTDTANSILDHVTTDEGGNTQYGRYELYWDIKGEAREGDYFICWTWTPQPAGDKLSAYKSFHIGGNTQVTTSIPTHYTKPGKYEELLERYLPEMFKMDLVPGDLTVDTIDKLNKSIAQGFTQLENLSNQLIDLQDANSLHESLLPYLSNFFNLKLKSGDPTLWRRQIKEAVPGFKKKGTLKGLKSALAATGVVLNKFTQMWQYTSKYTWVDNFKIEDPKVLSYVLSKAALPFDAANFNLSIRHPGDQFYTDLTNTDVTFSTTNGITTMTWTDSFKLLVGDHLMVLYKYANVPNSNTQLVEDYVRTLPLADLRDETLQDYPLKNWNVRVIEEDDPLFDVIIDQRHPFHDDIIFGKVRTEFPYSENVYNMEEYNGSTRDSKNPCDIDRTFLDPCSYCQSSKFTLDLEITELSNDRLKEATETIKEYVPFHSVLHSFNVSGGIEEFIQSPVEEVECLVDYRISESILSGNASSYFHRIMDQPNGAGLVRRTFLASTNTAVSGDTGIASNDAIALYTPDLNFNRIGLSTTNTILEVLAPSPNQGNYTLVNPSRNTVEVVGAPEPLNETGFTFRISNNVFFSPNVNIYQDDYFVLTDANVDFAALGVKSQWDVDHESSYTGSAWTVTLSGTHDVLNVLPNGGLVLADPGRSFGTSSVTGQSYVLKDDTAVSRASSTSGTLSVTRRGRARITEIGLPDISVLLKLNDYIVYGANQYKMYAFVEGVTNEGYIANYTGGDVVGIGATIYRRLADNLIGYFHYKGISLQAFNNLEANLGILNGANPPSDPEDIVESNHFLENYLIEINGEYFQIASIDQNNVVLSGPLNQWRTMASGGTVVTYNVLQFIKERIIFQGNNYDFIDRRGGEGGTGANTTKEFLFIPYFYTMSGGVHTGGATHAPDYVTRQLSMKGGVNMGGDADEDMMITGMSFNSVSGLAATALNSQGSEIKETIGQNESVSYTIEYRDGTIEQGEI
jgi:hypothetical protein